MSRRFRFFQQLTIIDSYELIECFHFLKIAFFDEILPLRHAMSFCRVTVLLRAAILLQVYSYYAIIYGELRRFSAHFRASNLTPICANSEH